MGDFWALAEPLTKGIGAVAVLAGGPAAIAYALFKVWGTSWLNLKFDQRLAAFNHEQDQQIERLRFQINALFDRMSKLHQREFDVLPMAWSLLVDADRQAKLLVAMFQQYPDVARMSAEQLEEFLLKSPFSERQKGELKASSDKNKYYQENIFWHRNAEVRGAFLEARWYHSKNGIFFDSDLDSKFGEMLNLIWEALFEREYNQEYPDLRPLQRDAQRAFKEKGDATMQNIRLHIRDRLRVQTEQPTYET